MVNIYIHKQARLLLILAVCVFIYSPRAHAAGGTKDLASNLPFHDVLMVTFQSHADEVQKLDSSILDKFAKLDLDQPAEQEKLRGLAASLRVNAKAEGISPMDFDIHNKQHAHLLVSSALQHQERVNSNAAGMLSVLRDKSMTKNDLVILAGPVAATLSYDSVGLFQHYEQALRKYLPALLRMRNEALTEAKQLSN